ncbi:MAG: hypothetical protein R6U63_11545 [Longimicrobiales bacterium]
MGQLPLRQVLFAADPVHDLELAAPSDPGEGGIGEEAEELAGLVGTGGHPEGVQGEAGVPYPGVAVIPVPRAAHRLGQRRGGRGDRGAGRVVRQPLEYPAAVVHHLPVRALIALVGLRPALPSGPGIVDPVTDLRLAPRLGIGLTGVPVLEREAGALAGLEGEAGAERGIVVVELHGALGALEVAEECAGRVGAQVVPPLVGADDQGVGQDHRAALRPERSGEDEGAVEVRALDVEVGGGPEVPVAGVVVEDPAEGRGRVEAGEAEPVHRSGAAHEGGAVAVREESVLLDGQRHHHSDDQAVRKSG